MKNQCLNYNYTFNAFHPIEKLVNKITENSQLKAQRDESKKTLCSWITHCRI